MPHLRPRYAKPLIDRISKSSSIIGILGQRQTGKTTLAEGTATEYVTLDDAEALEIALRSPRQFLSNRKLPFAIDECQMSPPLFAALKEHVRINKARGQFILTGSVRFTSVEEITESLTGRIVDIELLPLCLSEAHTKPLHDIFALMTSKNPLLSLERRTGLFGLSDVTQFIKQGGLPGLCFGRAPDIFKRKMRSHIKTILDRDIRQVIDTRLDFLTIKTFLEEIAIQQGEIFDLAAAARNSRIAINSARKLLSAFDAVFLTRTLRKDGDTSGKVVYLEDQGMATFLRGERGIGLSQLGLADLGRFLFQQLHAQIQYGAHSIDFSTYRTRSGLIVDFVLKSEGLVSAIIIGQGDQASSQQIHTAETFQKHFKGASVFLCHKGKQIRDLGSQIFECPITAVI